MKETHKLFSDIAKRFAAESHCISRKVAAIAVKDNRIVATGINGTPEGTCNCDEHWEKQYKDGNDFADGLSFDKAFSLWITDNDFREMHHVWSKENEMHAEQNLVSHAARKGIPLEGSTVYVTLSPCIDCAKLLIGVKPAKIVYLEKYDKSDSLALLEKAGIPTIQFLEE